MNFEGQKSFILNTIKAKISFSVKLILQLQVVFCQLHFTDIEPLLLEYETQL